METANSSRIWWPSLQSRLIICLPVSKAIVLVKLFIYDNFYLVENSYAKFVLGPMKRYSFLVT